MQYGSFDELRQKVERQYADAVYPAGNGWSENDLRRAWEKHKKENPEEDRLSARAFLIALILRHAPIAEETLLPFAGKLQTFHLLEEDRQYGIALAEKMVPGLIHNGNDFDEGIAWMVDLSHAAPDWKNILTLGLPGLIARAKKKETAFAKSIVMVYEALAQLCRRIAEVCHNPVYARIAEHAPETLHEAFALALLFHDAIEISHMAIRSMGRFDSLYIDFYREDIQKNRLTPNEAKDLIKFFFMTFYARHQGMMYGKNFCFGPTFNELSFVALEAYYELNTVDPKLSILVREDMPEDFLKLYAKCIRDGRTGIVSLNYDVIVEGLIQHGRSREDAENFIPIGCYEPAVAGKEISGSGTTRLYLPHVLMHFLRKNEEYMDFESFKKGYFHEIHLACAHMQKEQVLCDKAWKYLMPLPLLSGTMDSCLQKEKDVSDGGAFYNTTGCVISYFADAVDSLSAVKYLVYEKKLCTLAQLNRICQENWKNDEKKRIEVLHNIPRWGNNEVQSDSLAVELANFVSKELWALPNGRGGSFFPSLYGQLVVEYGMETPAFPSGRLNGEPLSKNMDAVIGMDRNGVTALMHSVLKIDMKKFPCGTCLDLMLHPSSVAGEEGLQILCTLIRSFIARGGSGLQFNIFDAAVLREAQKEPEKYQSLQVRVCGWNSRFNDLTHEAQESFIKQAENIQ